MVCNLKVCEFQLKNSSDKLNLIHGKLNELKIFLVFFYHMLFKSHKLDNTQFSKSTIFKLLFENFFKNLFHFLIKNSTRKFLNDNEILY